MKEHFCPAEQSMITYQGQCNWCGEREALAQTQEPVVWMYQDKSTHEVRFQKHMRDFVDHGATYETPLYTHPPQRTEQTLYEDDVLLICLACHLQLIRQVDDMFTHDGAFLVIHGAVPNTQ